MAQMTQKIHTNQAWRSDLLDSEFSPTIASDSCASAYSDSFFGCGFAPLGLCAILARIDQVKLRFRIPILPLFPVPFVAVTCTTASNASRNIRLDRPMLRALAISSEKPSTTSGSASEVFLVSPALGQAAHDPTAAGCPLQG